MFQKGYKQTKKQKEKIGRANSKKMKEYWANKRATKKQIKALIESTQRRKEKFGYVNSPKTREKLSEIQKNKWAKGEVTEKQRATLFKKGYDEKRVKTQFKDGHEVSEKTRLAVKKNRATQIFPKEDTKIEVKIQMFLKELGYEFFTHQHMNIKHSYQCDILIPALNLVVECDGDYWHKYPIGLEKDHIRTKELIEKGFKVLRLWEKEIKEMDVNDFKEKLRRGRD